jgi:hypothetical protein
MYAENSLPLMERATSGLLGILLLRLMLRLLV